MNVQEKIEAIKTAGLPKNHGAFKNEEKQQVKIFPLKMTANLAHEGWVRISIDVPTAKKATTRRKTTKAE